MKKGLRILAGSVLSGSIGIFLLSIVFRVSGIYYNNTPSLPVGFYKIIDEPVERGVYVSFCPPQDEVFEMAMMRNIISTDGDGHEMPQYRLKEKVLNDSEYLLMSDVNPNSFDARYFGLIAHAQIQHVVEPVFTWGN
ncbi:S26 family signal peptidase [Nitrosomonas supralitoralis]|uniref:Conjugative transfer signal peptidase TraF n=1 Tax=Nitrosomonas supralitoralis TaxID=2116706 RepID=A0A2P7NRT7_9PROT|nr:S26 family signal peptidase [Nitrosomonas supralitoralis]PSJ16183.1 conjugative transfer signal peptidase TraF [Nitrosomonas supralitoralis]